MPSSQATLDQDSRSPEMIRTCQDPECLSGSAPERVKSAGTEEVSSGIILDFDSKGGMIGIEVLDVSERMNRSKAAA
jgi:uncharacterized protein YuzE